MNNSERLATLKNVLIEIENVCPDVRRFFILTREGEVVSRDQKAEEVARVFQGALREAASFGGIDSMLVDGRDGRLLVSFAGETYLGVVTSENADVAYLQFVVPRIVGAIFRVLDKIEMKQEAVEKEEAGSKHLRVDVIGGFFARDVQIDSEVLAEWSDLFEGGKIIEVELSASGKRVLCKVKNVDDPELKGKGVVRLPKKVREQLGVKKGDLVKVVPATAISHGEFLVNKEVAEHYRS